MQSHCTEPFKQAFLKNLLLSLHLQQESSFGGTMSLHERKLAVKCSADVAMAAARGSGARWPKAILAPSSGTCKVRRCRRRIVIRCHGHKRSRREGRGDVARRAVRRRTMALRKVIPGGTDASVDEAALLREAMDYVVHLRAQVDVLRRVSEAGKDQARLSCDSWSPTALEENEVFSSDGGGLPFAKEKHGR